jgi:hypothetical protein
MTRFIIISEKTGAKITIPEHVQKIRDAVTWAQNYCDLSQEPWNVEQVKE